MKITVLFGTETGNCKGIADKVIKKGAKNGVEVEAIDLATYSVADLARLEDPVLIVISTWDDGAPPPRCVRFCKELEESTLSLANVSYSVLALGDKEYPLYCECGKKVDAQMEALGATKLMDRTDLGAEFMVSYIGWSKKFWKRMAQVFGVTA